MNEKEVDNIRKQLQGHLEYLKERINELRRMGHNLSKKSWLHEELANCETDIALWENIKWT